MPNRIDIGLLSTWPRDLKCKKKPRRWYWQAIAAMFALAPSIEALTDDYAVHHPRQSFSAYRGKNFSNTFTWKCEDGHSLNESLRYASPADACSALDGCWPSEAPHKLEPGKSYTEYLQSPDGLRTGGCLRKNNSWARGGLKVWKCEPGFDFDGATGLCEQGEPDVCDATTKTSAPVDIATGNKSIEEVDFFSVGDSLLEFKRSWQSQLRRWQFSYQQRLVLNNTGQGRYVQIQRPSGWLVTFAEKNGHWYPEARVSDALTVEGDKWRYTKASGDREWFDSSGRFIRLQKVTGEGLVISYPSANTMVVTDDHGQYLSFNLDGSGRIVSMTDLDLHVYEYFYSRDGHLETVVYPSYMSHAQTRRSYHYEDTRNPDLVTRITDENGDVHKTVVYDEQGRALLSGLGDGTIGQSEFDYTHADDAVDPRVRVTNSLNKQTTFHLENHFGLIKVRSVRGVEQPGIGCLADTQSREYYSETGWLKNEIDKAGNGIHYQYYTDISRYGLASLRVEGAFSSEQRMWVYDWHPSRLLKSKTLSEWRDGNAQRNLRSTTYTYHPNGREHTRVETDLTGLAEFATRTWTTSYEYYDPDTQSQVKTKTVDGPRDLPVRDITLIEYSPQGFVSKHTNSAGHVTHYRHHNSRGQPQEVEDANGVITLLEYHPRGWLEKITLDSGGGQDRLNAVTDLHYDNVGQLTGITLADGLNIAMRYDAGHRLREVENELGDKIKYALDGAGNQTGIFYSDSTQAVLQSAKNSFDGLSRLWRKLGASGQQVEFQYDEKGQLVIIDDGVNPAARHQFDAQNRISKITNADSDDLLIKYDAGNRVVSVTDQRGLVTDYVYDGFGDLQSIVSPDTGTTAYDYDAAGNRVKQTDARGIVTRYTYDALNRLTETKYQDDPEQDISYVYDNWLVPGVAFCNTCNGRLAIVKDTSGTTTYTYDRLGRLSVRFNEVSLPDSDELVLVTKFSFNAAGRLEKISYPNGPVVKHGFDAAGRVDSVSYAAADLGDSVANVDIDIMSNIRHQPFGPLRQADFANGQRLTRVYDLDGRLVAQEVAGASTVQNLEYDYDRVNNIRVINDLVDESRSETFTYDELNRLEAADGKYGRITYTYDEAGNRKTRMIERGALIITETYLYPAGSNRLDRVRIDEGHTASTRTFDYDPAGNLIQENRDGEAHLRYLYDSHGRVERVRH